MYMYTGAPCYNELRYDKVPLLMRLLSQFHFDFNVVQWENYIELMQ